MNRPKPLTHDDRVAAFLAVVGRSRQSKERWQQLAATGLTDDQLAAELERKFGIEGGSSARGKCPAIWYKGAGLRIWASWDLTFPLRERPIFAGQATISMAREIFAIPDPLDNQLKLF